jgi:hypothetical protein
MASEGSTTARGYGYQHQRLRNTQLAKAYGTACTRCGQVMVEGQALDLDHTDTRDGYRGFSHRKCNRAAGARKGNANRRRNAPTNANTSRDW